MIRQLKFDLSLKFMKSVAYAVLFAVLFLGYSSSSAMAAKQVTRQGVIQGASCVHNNEPCPTDEAHYVMESDFVLLLDDGSHYFLSNLSRTAKVRYVKRIVRVTGEEKGHELWVDKLEVKDDGEFRLVWSWKKQQEQYRLSGG